MTKDKSNYSPEVLIYIQNLRDFYEKNEHYRDFFKIITIDEFLKHIIDISQSNFEEFGSPELTIEQFEKKLGRIQETPFN